MRGRGRGKRKGSTVRIVGTKIIHWNNSWLQLMDKNGDSVGEYAVYVDAESGKCSWCNAVVKFNTQGRWAFLKHAQGDRHKNVANGRKQRLPDQPVIQPVFDAADEDNNRSNQDTNGNVEPPAIPGPSGHRELNQPGRGGGQQAGLGRGSMPLVVRRPGNQWTVGDQVVRAEILMVLKGAESNWSFRSFDNIAEVLRKMAPDNLILSKFTLMRNKTSYVLTYGLYPYFKKQLIDALKKSPAFTVSTDSATFKQGNTGLSKHVDYDIRFFDVNRNRVSDNFLDYSSLGREPANLQVEKLVGCFRSYGIDLIKVISLSRDNPRVMQAVFKLLAQELHAANNPGLVDAPCLLHPTHNAFKAACNALAKSTNEDVEASDSDSDDEEDKPIKLNVIDLLGFLHHWFKMSTARREDMMGVRGQLEAEQEDFEESLTSFYKRHIDTRWLEARPCLERLLNLWESTIEYFMIYLPTSSDPNNRRAVKSKEYKKIAAHLCDTQVHQTKAKIKFLIFIAKQTEPFLKKFQTERPQIHHLYRDSIRMFEEVSSLVVHRDFLAEVQPTDYPDLDFTVDDHFRNFAKCGYIPDLKTEFNQIQGSINRRELYLGMREAVRSMVIHLQKHLPFRNILLKEMGFLDPKYRFTRKSVPEAGVKVARLLKRFTEAEITQINIELTRYHSLSYDIIPRMGSDDHDPIDEWWMKTMDVIAAETEEYPDALAKLVKMCMVLSHGQAIVERGFSSTKDFVDGRNSMVDQTVKALKTTKQAITKAGGAHNVEITTSMINEVKASHQTFKSHERKEKEAKERSEAQQRQADQIADKRKRQEEETRNWEEKKKNFENEMRASQEIIDVQSSSVTRITHESLNKNASADELRSHMATLQFCQRNISSEQAKLAELNRQFANHMGKKPRK